MAQTTTVKYYVFDGRQAPILMKIEKHEDKNQAKSIAGREFHKNFIACVGVFDELGRVLLYLRKDHTGKVTKREEL